MTSTRSGWRTEDIATQLVRRHQGGSRLQVVSLPVVEVDQGVSVREIDRLDIHSHSSCDHASGAIVSGDRHDVFQNPDCLIEQLTQTAILGGEVFRGIWEVCSGR